MRSARKTPEEMLIRMSGNECCSRRGVLTAWSIFAILLSGLCTALVINHLWISAIHSETLQSFEAAALAAAHGLLSDDMLKRNQQPVEQEWRIARSRLAAVRMSEFYCRTRPIRPLTEDNVQFRFSDDQLSGSQLGPDAELPEYITVGFEANTAQSRIPLMLPGITGMGEAIVGIRAVVRLEHHPVGFQPLHAISIPLMPFCLPDDDGQSANVSWTRMIEQGHGHDQFAWSDERQEFEQGEDGLSEITVRLSSQQLVTSECDRLLPVQLCSQPFRNGDFNQQMQQGIALTHLESLALSRIRFPQAVQLLELDTVQFQEVVDTMNSLKGRAVIWCLSEQKSAVDRPSDHMATGPSGMSSEEFHQDDASSTTTIQLLRPVAARVVQVRLIDDHQAEITLQPCVLTTTTAVMKAGQPDTASRYIYSVRLIH